MNSKLDKSKTNKNYQKLNKKDKKKIVKEEKNIEEVEEEEVEEEEEEEDGDYDLNDGFIVNDDEDDNEDEDDDNNDKNNEDDYSNESVNNDLDSEDLEIIQKKPKYKKVKLLKKTSNDIQDDEDFDDLYDENNKINNKIKKEVVNDDYEEDINDYESENNAEEDDYSNNDENVYQKNITYKKKFNKNVHSKKALRNNYNDELYEQNEEEALPDSEKLKQLAKIYTKEELEEEYISEKDNLIKLIDIPERKLRDLSQEQLEKLLEYFNSKEDNNDNNSSNKLLKITSILNETRSTYDIMSEVDYITDIIRGYRMINNDNYYQKLREKIKIILENIQNDHLEIPYISLYRKMNYEPELNSMDIWNIYSLHKQYKQLLIQKEVLKQSFSQIKLLNHEGADFLESKYLDKARSIYDLKLINTYINFNKKIYNEDLELLSKKIIVKEEEESINNEKNKKKVLHKRPVKQREIPKAYRDSLIELGRQFSLTLKQFTTNLDMIKTMKFDINKIVIPKDPEIEPPELSKMYINDYYNNNFDLMKAVLNFLAQELCTYPPIRAYIFNFLRQYGHLSTSPTEKGETELDIFHQSFRVKRLLNKPLHSFNNDLFLDIVKNEKEKLISYNISFEDQDLKTLNETLLKCYVQPRVQYEITQKWNVIREKVIETLMELIIPEFKNEIIQQLSESAEKFIIQQASNNFFNLLMTGPYKKNTMLLNSQSLYNEESPTTLSVVYDNEKETAYCVMLDEYGEIKDIQSYVYLLNKRLENQAINDFNNNRPEPNDNSIINRETERKKFKEIIDKYSPELLVIAANNIVSKNIKDNLSQLMSDLTSNYSNINSFNNYNKNKDLYWITYGDLTIPYVFSTSSTADLKYSKYNLYVRQAISLGRFKQNPLAEVLQLWHEDPNNNRCLTLNLHPLLKQVNISKLSESFELEAIKAVNLIGVDINRVKNHVHLRKQLGFVSGLGFRKAAYLIEKITIIGELINRNDVRLYFGNCIMNNCIGFLKIKQYIALQNNNNYDNKYALKTISALDLNRHSSLLDLTRIHPEMYHFAIKIVKSAVDNNRDLSDNQRLEKVLLNPVILQELDLNEYTKKQEELGNFKFRPVLDFIINELNKPFNDPRRPHKDIVEYELFKILTADNPIEIGHIVLCKTTGMNKTHVFCRLENGLEGSLWKNDIFDEHLNQNEEEERIRLMYPKNCLFYARVKGINKATFKIDLITKPSKLKTHKDELKVNLLDEFFHINESVDFKNKLFNINENEALNDIIGNNEFSINNTNRKKYTKRNINHPHFKNINYAQCIAYLADKNIGDYVFRPSSKSNNHITLSWKNYENIYSHITIEEDDKPLGANIGSKLRIGNDVFYNLHEIIDKYLKPCEMTIKENILNRKFVSLPSLKDIDNKLVSEKQKDPIYIHYLFTLNSSCPQYFILAYIPKPNSVVKEYIKIKPRGLFFHNLYFFDLNEVAKYFKTNYSKEDYRMYVKKTKAPVSESINNFSSTNNYLSAKNNDINSNSRNNYDSYRNTNNNIDSIGHKRDIYNSKYEDYDRNSKNHRYSNQERSRNNTYNKHSNNSKINNFICINI